MANAMLEDDFKSSHPDLVACERDEEMKQSSALKDSASSTSPSRANLIRKKSVDFTLDETPPKRLRHSETWTAKQVVDAISTCISRHERLEAIQKARDAFNHDVTSIHDDEMATGADAALAKHLTFLAYQAERHKSNAEDEASLFHELSMTCDAMESLYRASSEIVGASFRRMGKEILEILVHLIEEEVNRRFEVIAIDDERENPDDSDDMMKKTSDNGDDNDEDGDDRKPAATRSDDDSSSGPTKTRQQTVTRVRAGTPEGDNLLRKATKIIGHFARVGNNTKEMAHFRGLLPSLIRLITSHATAGDCIPWEARLSALWTVANLACNTENMQMMVCIPGLVGALVEVACRPLHPGDSLETIIELLRSRSIASRAILNLSWAPENKMILAEHTAVVDLLSELSVHRAAPLGNSRTVKEILTTTRRHAVSALRNLAAAPRRIKIGLCDYKNGHLLDVLTDAALNDQDEVVKDRCFAAIHNLAIQDTAQKIVNHPALVLALRNVLSDQEDSSAKSHASATLLVLERTITPEMESYENLRDLLDVVNPAPTSSEENESDMEVVNATAV